MDDTHAPLAAWLKHVLSDYEFDVGGIFRRAGHGSWPLTAPSPDALESALKRGGHLLPLPKEPAALANVLEVSIVDYLDKALETKSDASGVRGTERGYPDMEILGDAFGGGHHAVDIKVARRASTRRRDRTQSRITLYTGNTYFKWPDLHWPGTFRPFSQYRSHLDIIVIYTLNETSDGRVEDMELIVQEPWRIASKSRSSTTREYIGAVDLIAGIRGGYGEFETPDAFYRYWRNFNFKISSQVQRQLHALLQRQQVELDKYRSRDTAPEDSNG